MNQARAVVMIVWGGVLESCEESVPRRRAVVRRFELDVYEWSRSRY